MYREEFLLRIHRVTMYLLAVKVFNIRVMEYPEGIKEHNHLAHFLQHKQVVSLVLIYKMHKQVVSLALRSMQHKQVVFLVFSLRPSSGWGNKSREGPSQC